MRPILFLYFFLPVALCAQSTRTYFEDDQRAPRERLVDFTHLRLEVAFTPEKGLVKGTVTHFFTPLRKEVDSIVLDGPGIRVLDLLLNGKKAEYKNEGDLIIIYCKPALLWETKDSLTITYEANPRKGLYFIGWNDPLNLSRKQIWSQGQGTDNRMWIPMYDEMNDKITSELIVRFDSKYKVLSNGTQLSSKSQKDGTTRWHYRMKNPHAPYLIMLGIGIYDIKTSKSKSGVPMNFYYYPEHKDRVEITYRYSEQMMDWFENETGFKYGWESYSQ
ncbi:MAG: hypothetical protein IT233_12110, partial [Bacteroidia bacterium]|nr:hypothetical protein [Bacteroidia bacterium]